MNCYKMIFLAFVIGIFNFCVAKTAYPVETYRLAVQSSRVQIQERVLLDIAESGSPAYREVVFDYLMQKDIVEVNWHAVFCYFSKNDETILPDAIDYFQKHNTGILNFLVALTNRGSNTEGIAKFIHRKLAEKDLQANERISLRIALATTNHQSDENTKAIEAFFRDNKDAVPSSALIMMGLQKDPTWPTPLILDILKNNVIFPWEEIQSEDENVNQDFEPDTLERSYFSAAALSRIANPETTEILIRASRYARNYNELMSAILYDICMARLQPDQTEAVIHNALRYLGSEGGNRYDYYAWLLTRMLLNESMKTQILKGLHHEEDDIVNGSLIYFACFPILEARTCRLRIYELIETSPSENIRQSAVMSLSMIADRNDIPVITNLSDKESSESVKDAFKNTIKILLLQEEI